MFPGLICAEWAAHSVSASCGQQRGAELESLSCKGGYSRNLAIVGHFRLPRWLASAVHVTTSRPICGGKNQ